RRRRRLPGLPEHPLARLEARDRVAEAVLGHVVLLEVPGVGVLVRILLVEEEAARVRRVAVELVGEDVRLVLRALAAVPERRGHGVLLALLRHPRGAHGESHPVLLRLVGSRCRGPRRAPRPPGRAARPPRRRGGWRRSVPRLRRPPPPARCRSGTWRSASR